MTRDAPRSVTAMAIGYLKTRKPASASWLQVLLALSFMALVASALFSLFSNYRRMMEREGDAAANLADSMQVYVTEVLKQSLASANVIATDVQGTDASKVEARLAALRGAMRYDPVSSILGIANPRASLMIDATGKRLLLPQLQASLDKVLMDKLDRRLTVLPIIYSKELNGWYLPVQVALTAVSTGRFPSSSTPHWRPGDCQVRPC